MMEIGGNRLRIRNNKSLVSIKMNEIGGKSFENTK